MFLPILCRAVSLLKGYSTQTLEEISGNISGAYVLAKERDAEEFLCSLTNGQRSLCVHCVSPASSPKLSTLNDVRGQGADVHPFFKGPPSAKCQSFNISNKNNVQRNYVQLKSFLSPISPPPATTRRNGG